MGEELTNAKLKSPKVFISYSHDSDEHCDKVQQFAKALLNHGVDAELDQWHMRPAQGWNRWCEEQLRPNVSDFVLIICTASYLARVENRASANEGRGVFWEGSLIYNYLYDEKENKRFIPVLFPGSNEQHIPRPLRAYTRYHLEGFSFECAGYEALYRELTGQPAVTKPPLGEVVTLPTKQAALIVAPALPMREVKTSFQAPTNVPHSENGNLTMGDRNAVVPQTKSFIAHGTKKLSRFVAVLTILTIPLLWFLYSNESWKALRKTSWRHVRDAISEAGRQRSPSIVQAKLKRHMAWIAEDFADDPLSILDTLDRAVSFWTNITTAVSTNLQLAIPFTNHFALLSSLSSPAHLVKADWQVSEKSEDPVMRAILQRTLDLKQVGIYAEQHNEWTQLPGSLLLPFSDIFQVAGTVNTNGTVPTAEELNSFCNSTTKVLSQVQLVHVVGGVSDESRWLFLCELRGSASDTPLLVLFHSTWKPKGLLALSNGSLTRINPDEWQSDCEVILPPTAWNLEAAWSEFR